MSSCSETTTRSRDPTHLTFLPLLPPLTACRLQPHSSTDIFDPCLRNMRSTSARLLQIVDKTFVENLPKSSSRARLPRVVMQPISAHEPKPTRLIDTLLAEQSAGSDWPPNLRVEPVEKRFGLVTSSVARRMKQLLVEEPPVNWKPKKEPREIWRAPLKKKQRKNLAEKDKAGEPRGWVAKE